MLADRIRMQTVHHYHYARMAHYLIFPENEGTGLRFGFRLVPVVES
jgi:hypothetical protein